MAERRNLHREQAAALLNLADLDAETGRTHEALARYRAALDAGRAANDPYAAGRAMESVGGAYQELADWHRASDWFGRALSQALARGSARTRRGCTAGSETYTRTRAGTGTRCAAGGRRPPATGSWPMSRARPRR